MLERTQFAELEMDVAPYASEAAANVDSAKISVVVGYVIAIILLD